MWKFAFKWNVAHLQWNVGNQHMDKWVVLPEENSFFSKLKHVSRFYRELCKDKARESKKEELDLRAKLP